MSIEIDSALAESLPFEPKQQDAIFGYALIDKGFFVQIKDRVKPGWFIDGWTGKAYKTYVEFFNTFGHPPKSDDEFFLFENVFALPPLEKQKLKSAVIRARTETANYSLDVLKTALTGWLQSRIYHQYVSQSATLFNARKFAESKTMLAKAVKELQEITFEGKAPADFSNPRALVQQILNLGENALTLGHPLLDRMLSPDSPSGRSLVQGDSTVFLAPTNVGKTTAAITVAVANLMAGKKVFFITHEGRKTDIMEKIWQCLLRATKAEFRALSLSDNPAVISQMTAFAQILADRLVYIDYQKPGTTVEEVVSIMRQHQQLAKNTTGQGFDLIVNDYPAIIGTEDKSIVRERRMKDAYVYRYLTDYAGSESIHGLFSIQTNREGSKKNRQVGEYANKRFLTTLEDVQEAYEVTNSATNLLTLNQSPSDKAREIFTFLICKSRSSDTNIAVSCQSNFRCARTHDAEKPATWYRGVEAPENIDTLLVQYANQEIPHNHKEMQNATSKS
jgi:hypothetical protein